MADEPREEPAGEAPSVVEAAALPRGAVLVRGALAEGLGAWPGPLKVVTGTQQTHGLRVTLEPGAIVAHAGACVIVICS